MTDFGLLALAALFEGVADQPHVATERGLAAITALGRRPMKHGKPLSSDSEAIAFLDQHIRPVLGEMAPLWRRLGIV